MAGFRRHRFLACFYCGRKTSTPYDGLIRHFDCPNCDATNYLDENGEITDPPVATTEAEPPTARYAISRATSPTSSVVQAPATATFCATCLKNQHLFAASLAQYLPDDPNHPDYAELERKYYTFRKNLEKRYPQVCADCEPKVLDRIKQAGYTAKTDHLRRMIDRSRQVRTTQKSTLDVVETLGRWLWFTGLVLQLLWQISAVYDVLCEEKKKDIDGRQWIGNTMRVLQPFVALLPSADRLARLSITASASSCWWNPRLVQTVRGFTKHIIGLSSWYTYQVTILFVRSIFLMVSDFPSGTAPRLVTQIGAHVFMALFTSYLYAVALHSLRTDTTPLFGRMTTTSLSLLPADTKDEVEVVDDRNLKTMSDILDEIAASPPRSTSDEDFADETPFGTPFSRSHTNFSYPSPSRTSPDSFSGGDLGNPFTPKTRRGMDIVSLRISEPEIPPSPQQAPQYEEEMDWTPTQSRYRAFNTYEPSQSQAKAFGQTPVEANRGQFWYKVPPAPTSMAQRVFNPPNAPRLRVSPATKQGVSFRGANGGGALAPREKPNAEKDSAGVRFAEPSFFSSTPNNDPRNKLSDLFNQSFTLDSGQEKDDEGRARDQQQSSQQREAREAARFPSRSTEFIVLVTALLVWLYAASAQRQNEHSAHAASAVLCAFGALSARLLVESARQLTGTRGRTAWASVAGVLLGTAEGVLAYHAALPIWAAGGISGESVNQGGFLAGTLLLHEVWNSVW